MADSDENSSHDSTTNDFSSGMHRVDENEDKSDISGEQYESEEYVMDSDSDSDSLGDLHVAGPSGDRGCGQSSQWSHAYFQTLPRVFSANEAPPLGNVDSPFDYFSLVFPVDIYQLVSDQTNLYAKQKLMSSGVAEAQVGGYFEPTTVDEIRAYIGLLMYMNINVVHTFSCTGHQHPPVTMLGYLRSCPGIVSNS